MGVKVINREYKNQYKGDTKNTNWLIGNVGDWQQLTLDIEAEIIFQATAQESLQINYVDNSFVLMNGSSWGDYGFDIGMEVVFKYDLNQDSDGDNETDAISTIAKNYTIKNILSDKMFVNENIDADGFELLPINYGTRSVTNIFMTSEKEVEGINFGYTHLLNSNYQTESLNSIIDGTKTFFSFSDLKNVNAGDWQEMLPVGNQSGMAIESCEIRKSDALVGANDVFIEMIPLNGSYTLDGDTVSGSNNDFDYQKIPITLSDNGDYQTTSTSTSVGLSSAGIPIVTSTDCFLYNSSSAYSQDLLFDMILKVVDTNETDEDDYFSLEILRFSGGSNLSFAESISVQTWLDSRSQLGKELNITSLKTIEVNEGDSFVLVLKLKAPNGNYITYEVKDSKIQLSNINSVFNQKGVQFFQVRIIYMIASFFEKQSNFENLTIPSFLGDDESLTDNFDIKLFPVWNNPNVVIKNDIKETKRLGNTGWFNENLNGLKNYFNVDSVLFFDDYGNSLNQLDYSTPVNVEVFISGINNLNSLTECSVGFAWIPQNDEDFHNKATPFHQNLFVSTGRKYTDGVNDSFNIDENTGTDVFEGNTNDLARMDLEASENVMFSIDGVDKLKLKVRFIPNSDFSVLFDSKNDNDRNYILWVSCADQSLDINFTDRVSLLVDYNELTKNILSTGPYDSLVNSFLEHHQLEDEEGVDEYCGFLEDDILSKMNFNIDTNDGKVFRSMSFGYEVYNTSTGSSYELERYTVNLTTFPIGGSGVQEFNIDNIRGFKLESGNNKNWVKIERDSENDTGTLKYFKAFFGSKIRWEDWISRDGVPDEFFNNELENNGYHNNWLDYLRSGQNNDYIINFVVYTELTEFEDLKLHKNTFKIDFDGYDENTDIETIHNYYRDSDNLLLNAGVDSETGNNLGVLLKNEPTRIEMIFTNLIGDFDFQDIYGVISLEVENGAGQLQYRQLSSVWGSEFDNILIPLKGENRLRVEDITSNVLKLSCLVDNTKLSFAERYKLTGRIGCKSVGIGVYESAYESAYE